MSQTTYSLKHDYGHDLGCTYSAAWLGGAVGFITGASSLLPIEFSAFPWTDVLLQIGGLSIFGVGVGVLIGAVFNQCFKLLVAQPKTTIRRSVAVRQRQSLGNEKSQHQPTVVNHHTSGVLYGT